MGDPIGTGRSSDSSPGTGNPGEPSSFSGLLHALPAALYVTDAAGRLTFYNNAAAMLWEHQPAIGTEAWTGFRNLYWPDGTLLPHRQSPLAIALEEGRAIHGMEVIAERLDGTRLALLAYPTPLFGSTGEVTGVMNMLVDVTAHNRAEIATQRLAAIVESSDEAIVSKDLNGIITSWNSGAERLFGYTEQEAVGKPVTLLIPPDRWNEEPEILQRIRGGERIDHYETVRQKKDGSQLDVSLCISPIVGRDGRIVGASKIARDISDRKSAEKYKDVLLNEMRHRLKNTFALVASISRQTFRSATDDERGMFSSRLQALADAHDVLSRQSWESVCLREVVLKTMEPHRTGQGRIHISGPDIDLDSARAVTIALALHELATNAVKYGALSDAVGKLDISWERLDDRMVRLRWKEHEGPPVVAPARRGFGTRLIERGLAAELTDVLLEFRPGGVVCEMTFIPRSAEGRED